MRGLVAVVHPFGVGTDLAVFAGDQLEEPHYAAFVHGAEHKGRSRVEQVFSMSLPKPIRPFAKSFGVACLICQLFKKTQLIVSMWWARKANWYLPCVWFVSKASQRNSIYYCSFGVLKERGRYSASSVASSMVGSSLLATPPLHYGVHVQISRAVNPLCVEIDVIAVR